MGQRQIFSLCAAVHFRSKEDRRIAPLFLHGMESHQVSLSCPRTVLQAGELLQV